jgi:hypothetical protein
LQRISTNTRETEITDLDDSGRSDEDVGRLEVSVEDMVGVEVEDAV